MCFELYKFVIIPLILNSCQLTRLDHKCWPLDDGVVEAELGALGPQAYSFNYRPN